MRLRYSTVARAHIDAIYDFLTERNPAAARRIIGEIRAAARRLVIFPHMGREGPSPGVREWVIQGSPYLIVYEIDPEKSEIWLLGVFHGAQDRRERGK